LRSLQWNASPGLPEFAPSPTEGSNNETTNNVLKPASILNFNSTVDHRQGGSSWSQHICTNLLSREEILDLLAWLESGN